MTATIFRAQLLPVKQKLLVELARGEEGNLHLVEGESGADLVQQPIGAGDVDQRAIGGNVGGNGNRVVDEWDSGRRVGVEVIDQDAAAIARDDVGLGGIGREEKIDGVERPLADVDVDRSEGCVLSGLGEGDDLGTERGEGGPGEDVVAIMSMPVLSMPKKKSRPLG